MKSCIFTFLILCLFSCKSDEFKFTYCLNSTVDSISYNYIFDSIREPNLVIQIKTKKYLDAENVFAVDIRDRQRALKKLRSKLNNDWYECTIPLKLNQYNMITRPIFYIIKDTTADPICIDTTAIIFYLDSSLFINSQHDKVSFKSILDSSQGTINRLKEYERKYK
jgi:hypothetical protein